MFRRTTFTIALLVLYLLLPAGRSDAADKALVHPLFADHMVLQRDLAARGIAYGQSIEYSEPEFKSMEVADGKARLRFEHVGGGLIARGGEPLKGFAGADRQFVFADAKIDGDTVVVSSPHVAEPVAVRYGWANNPVCNLYKKAGRPASPFRTDFNGQ